MIQMTDVFGKKKRTEKIDINITITPYNIFKSNIVMPETKKRRMSVRKDYTSLTESFVPL